MRNNDFILLNKYKIFCFLVNYYYICTLIIIVADYYRLLRIVIIIDLGMELFYNCCFERIIKQQGFLTLKEFYNALKSKGYTDSYTTFITIVKYKDVFMMQTIGVVCLFANVLKYDVKDFLNELNIR